MTPLLAVADLRTHFFTREGVVKAADGVSLTVGAGEVLGLVGESGSGKSTVARLLMRLLVPTAGRIRFEGRDITTASGGELQRLRERIQIVFQDPHASLNPRKTVFASVAEPLLIHRHLRGAELRRRVESLFGIVGLPADFLFRYPHELSGGQKQRVCIARAVALDPKLLILDEPTSALDVSVQAQILEFLRQLQERLGLTYLFISHNLAVVRHLCDHVAVMYLGRIVEQGPTAAVFGAPKHPYTRALLSAVPLPQARQPGGRIVLTGDIPSPIDPPAGCPFHPRCPEKIGPVCSRVPPALSAIAPDRAVACHLYGPA